MSAGRYGGSKLLLSTMVLSVAMTSCAAQHDESLRLSEELGHARADAAWYQMHATELESRVSRLEQRATEHARVRNIEDEKLVARVEHLIAANESWLSSQEAALRQGPVVPAAEPSVPPAKKASPEQPGSEPEQQLRSLVERLRGPSGRAHGRLTREQEAAMRVLLRTDRKLDNDNPWAASFY